MRLEEDIRSLKIVRNILKSGGAFWHGKILARFSMQGALPSKGASIEGRDAETKIRYDEMVGEKKSNVGFSAANSACQLENPGVTESEREADVLLATLFMLKLNHGMMAVE